MHSSQRGASVSCCWEDYNLTTRPGRDPSTPPAPERKLRGGARRRFCWGCRMGLFGAGCRLRDQDCSTQRTRCARGRQCACGKVGTELCSPLQSCCAAWHAKLHVAYCCCRPKSAAATARRANSIKISASLSRVGAITVVTFGLQPDLSCTLSCVLLQPRDSSGTHPKEYVQRWAAL